MTDNIVVRPAQESDKTKILDLLNNVFYEQQRFDFIRNDAYWHWKYTSNVFGETYILIAEAGNKIAASTVLWPWQFICRGRVIQAYQACDSVVHPEYRGIGIYSKINKSRIDLAIEKNASFLYTFPNDKSLKGNLKVGWNYLAKLPWLVRPLRAFRILKNFSGSNKAASESLEDQHRINCSVCHDIARSGISYDGMLRTNYLKDYFHWRYENHPVFNYGMVTVAVGKCESAAIFMINSMGNLKEMIVVESMGSYRCTVALFREVIKTARQYNVDYITSILTPSFGMNELWRLGFIKIKNKHMVVMPIDFSLENKIMNYSNWSMAGGMHDAL
jgi:hypothetical protein